MTRPKAERGAAPPKTADQVERSALAILRELKAGRVRAGNLSSEDRQTCVDHLSAEGYSAAEIAEILRVSERTIARDRAALRAHYRLNSDPGFGAEFAGNLARQAELAAWRLLRVYREKEAPHFARIAAAAATWKVQLDLLRALQSLGQLPIAGSPVRAEASAPGADGDAFLFTEAETLARLTVAAGDEGAPFLDQINKVLKTSSVRILRRVATRLGPLAAADDAAVAEGDRTS